AILPAKFERQALGARGIRRGTLQHVLDQRRAPGLGHQRGLRIGRRRWRPDERNDLVDVRQRDGEAFQDMPAFTRAPKLVAGAADDDLTSMLEEELEE